MDYLAHTDPDYNRVQNIRGWTDEVLASELRNPKRASLGQDGYYLLIAEALARLLMRRMGVDGTPISEVERSDTERI